MKKEEEKMSEILEQNPFKLGFGLMRLPKNPDGTIDIPQVSEMADHRRRRNIFRHRLCL